MENKTSVSSIVNEETRLDSLRCSKIYCKNGGHIIYRNLDPTMKWEVLFLRAIKNPDEYDVEYDKSIVSEVDGDGVITWVREDLQLKSFPELRKIGLGKGVTGRDKDGLINNILKAQAKQESQDKQ
jgi:hypothetical protein